MEPDRVGMGYRAKQLLDFKELWHVLEENAKSALFNTAYNDTETRENEYKRYLVILDIKSVLNAMYEDALAIQAQDAELTN